jgi:hypothetical protein
MLQTDNFRSMLKCVARVCLVHKIIKEYMYANVIVDNFVAFPILQTKVKRIFIRRNSELKAGKAKFFNVWTIYLMVKLFSA